MLKSEVILIIGLDDILLKFTWYGYVLDIGLRKKKSKWVVLVVETIIGDFSPKNNFLDESLFY